jgi:hypothetical protein
LLPFGIGTGASFLRDAVSGRVKGLPQDALADLCVVLMLANPPNGHLDILKTIIKADGSFEFTGISTGRYALRVVRAHTADTIDVPYAPVVLTFEVTDKDVRNLEFGYHSGECAIDRSWSF